MARVDIIVMIMGTALIMLALPLMTMMNVEAATVTEFEDDNSCAAIPILDDVESVPCGSCQNIEGGKSFVFNSDNSTAATVHGVKDCNDPNASKLTSNDDNMCVSVPANSTFSVLVDCN
ncbi:hypothetical protein Sjap_005730 [Stephania japonica]|uniref:Uncharacterized protein n=1 Tax=Stephania japonica TaxID=461633 RepID=A0AAP0K4N9_9MAGN